MIAGFETVNGEEVPLLSASSIECEKVNPEEKRVLGKTFLRKEGKFRIDKSSFL